MIIIKKNLSDIQEFLCEKEDFIYSVFTKRVVNKIIRYRNNFTLISQYFH